MPIDKGKLIVATPSDAHRVGYEPRTPGDFNDPPDNLGDAMDEAREIDVTVSTTAPAAKVGRLWYDTAADSAATGVRAITSITADYTALLTDGVIFADASAGNITITLPAVADRTGKQFDIKKIDSSANTVTITGSEPIDEDTTLVLTDQYEAVTVVNDATEWWVL